MLKLLLKIPIQRAYRHPVYSMINIIGLAIGLACFIIVMLWVRNETSYDKFHQNSQSLYRVAFKNKTNDYYSYYQTGTLAGYLKQEFPEIIASTSFNIGQCKVAFENRGLNCKGSYAEQDFFRMFSFPFIRGDASTALSKPYSVIITESLSEKLFGENDPVGKLVKINDNDQYEVVGVINNVPQNSHLQFDLLMPFCNTQGWMKTWDSKWTMTYVMLQDGSQPEELSHKIARVMDRFQPTWNNILFLVPLTKSHLYNLNGGGSIIYVWVFSLMAIVVLVLACVNFMNLSTSRSDLRHKEIFIKNVLGSGRSSISTQFLFEAVMLSFAALIIAVIVVKITLPFVNNSLQTQLYLNFNIRTISTLSLVTLLTGIIAGSYPAYYLSSLAQNKILKGKVQNFRTKKWNLRHVLVIFQFTISVFFIGSALVVSKQLSYLKSKDLGIQKENILRVSTHGGLSEKASDLKQELLKNPNIRNVTLSNNNMTSFNNSGPINWEGGDISQQIEIGYNWVDEDFLKTFDLKMKEGRFFSKDYSSDKTNAFVLNQKAVSYLGLENPIGKKVKSWFDVEGTIIGIIEDFNTMSLHSELGPIALLNGGWTNFMFIRINGQDIPSTLKFISEKIKGFAPDDPIDYQFLDEQIDSLYQTEALTDKITFALTTLAILISCLGLLGLALSTLGQRTKEIGIRKVNGATISEILVLLNRNFVKWVAIAFVIATPIAWYAMHRWLENFAYKTELSWWIFALAGLLAFGIALLTVSWQSWRAATRNPAEALRYE